MSNQSNETRTTPAPPRSGALLFEPSARVSSARDIAELVFKHLRFGLGVFGTVMFLSIAVVYLMPPIYQSTSKVLVERGKRPTQRSDALEYQMDAFEAITAEIEILKSRTVAEDVVDRLRLVERPVNDTLMRRIGEGIKGLLDNLGLLTRLDRRESLIKGIQDALTVVPAPQSSVLVITYAAESASEAAEIATAITESYLAHHEKVFRVDTAKFYEDRVKEIVQELDQLRERQSRETQQALSQSLLMEVGVLEKAYASYRERLNAAKAEMAADQSMVNVRILDRPVVAARPARSRMFLLFLALAGGMLLAISLAVLREYFDHDVYSARDFDGSLDLPVLGSVAFVKGPPDALPLSLNRRA